MAMYHLNMAREQVLTLEKRRRLFRWVFSYLAVAVAVIAGSAYYLTVSIVNLRSQTRAMDEAERRFLRQRPGVQNMDKCLTKVTAEAAGLTATLDAVTQFNMMGQKSAAAIVLGLAEALPQGVNLGRLTLDGAEGTVKFEVYVPVTMKQEAGLTMPSLISRWEGSVLLTNLVRQITSENSARSNLEGREYLNWRFAGAMERNSK